MLVYQRVTWYRCIAPRVVATDLLPKWNCTLEHSQMWLKDNVRQQCEEICVLIWLQNIHLLHVNDFILYLFDNRSVRTSPGSLTITEDEVKMFLPQKQVAAWKRRRTWGDLKARSAKCFPSSRFFRFIRSEKVSCDTPGQLSMTLSHSWCSQELGINWLISWHTHINWLVSYLPSWSQIPLTTDLFGGLKPPTRNYDLSLGEALVDLDWWQWAGHSKGKKSNHITMIAHVFL